MARATKPAPAGPEEQALGAAFRRARQAANMTLADCADNLSVAINTVRWHEAGATMMPDAILAHASELLAVNAATIGFGHKLRSDIAAYDALCAQHGIRPELPPVRKRRSRKPDNTACVGS